MNHTAPQPAYAVVVPAFNAARTLHDAISSVLRQTVPPGAIIVVDDGSTDETMAIAAGFGGLVLVVSQANQGAAAATDHGLRFAQLPVVAGLDADDVWLPDKAERQLALLAHRPDVDAVFCRSVVFDHGGSPDPSGPARDAWSRSAMMMRRATAERMGPVFYAGNPRGLGEMIRWFDRGRRLGLLFEMMPDVLVGRRLIGGSLSSPRDPRALLPLIRARLAERADAKRSTGPTADRSEP